jgi:sugar/nucleoside kinase (ribokinase family)
MIRRPVDIVAIGDITSDAFIRLKNASIHCNVKKDDCEICLPFGEKIPFEYVKVIHAVGNAANVAVASSRLGLKTSLISDIGNDENGEKCLAELQRNKVITTNVRVHKDRPTNYHFVLWYEEDRTILVNHTAFDYKLPTIPETKWIYLTSLASNARDYHEQIIEYLNSHPNVKLAFQPGTYQINLGLEALDQIYKHTTFLTVNLKEAQKLLKTENRDIKTLLKRLHDHGPQLVAVTDGPRGAYLFDGEHYYFMPVYPDPRPAFERTGCGDAWTATFVAALVRGKSPLEAFIEAPINAMSVAQFIGSQEGLMTQDQLNWWLERAPEDYKVKQI